MFDKYDLDKNATEKDKKMHSFLKENPPKDLFPPQNTKEIVENFESKDKTVSPGKMAELIEDINTSMKDDLNIGKNRAAYQDELSQMHENVNLSMLKTLSDQKSAIPDDHELQRIQNLRQHRDTLSELEEFLDEVRD